jgi:Type I restriction enzyme R protein N terminus (HSDR_N)
MTKTTARVRPEAEIEALLASALSLAFPLIPREQFKHQVRFAVRLGHDEEELDGAWLWEAQGRADIILYHEGRALAVVELKREDLTLTDADRAQGQSYASQLTPRPPLVIVTNGKTVEIFDSNTGDPWSVGDNASDAVAKLLQNAATVAAAGMRWAIEALMGPAAGLWTKAVRARTAHLIGQLTAAPAQIGKPFARDFLYPRAVTQEAEAALLKGDTAIVLIEGPPLIGKSNVLRELALRTEQSCDLAMLMLRGGGGAGLFQRIANLFAAELEWEVTADNIRHWLRRMSRFDYGPILVLAIDGLEARYQALVRMCRDNDILTPEDDFTIWPGPARSCDYCATVPTLRPFLACARYENKEGVFGICIPNRRGLRR